MDAYNELLNATIDHLQKLKQGGTRYVPVSAELLGALSQPPASSGLGSRREAVTPAPKSTPRASTSASVPVARESGDKATALTELRERALVCQKCTNLASSRRNVVWGIGSIEADLMFIGEAPGADEDEQGEPFVGRAGQLLTKIIQTMGLSRETVYIANILKCRPDTPNQSHGNRPPTPKEMENCLPYLHAQIDLIKPKVIVALGGTAVDGLFGKVAGIGITKARGQWREYRGIPVMPTYHPSFLLRPNPGNPKREVWEDMLQVMERLGMPISEKQQGYFLRT
jgi:uracil-DNA glycosylase family 4